VVAAREGRPGIDTHGAAHRRTVHLRLAADRDLVDAALLLTTRPEDRVDLLRIERARRRVDLCARHFALSAARLLHPGDHLAPRPPPPPRPPPARSRRPCRRCA